MLGAATIGTTIFAGLALLSIYPELRSGPNASGLLQTLATVLHGVVLAGLAPWLLLVYFWGICRLPRDWAIGSAAIALSLPVHYVVVAVMAHAVTPIAVFVASTEVLIALGLIWYWHHNRRAAHSD